MKSQFITADELANILKVGKFKAYEIIRNTNNELKSKGYITVQGRGNAKYIMERLGIE